MWLLAKGFHEQAGLDFSEIFSPLVKPTTIRVVLTISLARGWPIRQLDINNAFPWILKEDTYMAQRTGFQQSNHSFSMVCKLRKALYGLKQAPRA